MTDSKYFTTTKKGEIFELKSELNNDKKEKKKEAVKKVQLADKSKNIMYCLQHLLVGHCFNDCRKRCISSVSRCSKLYADRQFRIKKIGVFVFDELCQITTRYGNNGSKYFC